MASMPQSAVATQVTTPPSLPSSFCIGLETLDHAHWVQLKELPGTISAQLTALRQWHEDNIGLRSRVAATILCRRFYLASAKIQQCAGPASLETLQQVQVEGRVKSDSLTRGFTKPGLVLGCDSLVEYASSAHIDSRIHHNAIIGQEALVIAHELDKGKIVAAFTLLAVLTIAICVLVGVLAHSAELGAPVGAAVFALLAILQVLLIWKYQ